jgi:hypothetical protein
MAQDLAVERLPLGQVGDGIDDGSQALNHGISLFIVAGSRRRNGAA